MISSMVIVRRAIRASFRTRSLAGQFGTKIENDNCSPLVLLQLQKFHRQNLENLKEDKIK